MWTWSNENWVKNCLRSEDKIFVAGDSHKVLVYNFEPSCPDMKLDRLWDLRMKMMRVDKQKLVEELRQLKTTFSEDSLYFFFYLLTDLNCQAII